MVLLFTEFCAVNNLEVPSFLNQFTADDSRSKNTYVSQVKGHDQIMHMYMA